MIKVSVIVPVYKINEPVLRKCIDSLTSQSLKELEIILVDDGSPDNCGDICDEYSNKYSNIKTLHCKNEGVSAARNAGLTIAKGEYIGFVDADDYVESDMFQKMYIAASSNKADMITSAYFKDKSGNIQKCGCSENMILNKTDALKEFLYFRLIDFTVWNKLFLHEKIGDLRFESGQTIGEDKFFIFEFINKAEIFICTSECFYHYVIHSGSAMKSPFNEKKLSSIYFADKIDAAMNNQPPEFREAAMFAKATTYTRVWAAINRENFSKKFSKESKKIRNEIKQIPLSFVRNFKSRKVQLVFIGIKFCPHLLSFLLKQIWKNA